jgi:hypothetical protein
MKMNGSAWTAGDKKQWIRLLDLTDDIRSFIAENDSKLKARE